MSIDKLNTYKSIDSAWDKYAPTNSVEREIVTLCNQLGEMLIDKNRAYGNSFETPMNIFSKATAEDQILARIDDKLSRIMRGTEYPGDDTIMDTIGYLILLLVLKKRQLDPSKNGGEWR